MISADNTVAAQRQILTAFPVYFLRLPRRLREQDTQGIRRYFDMIFLHLQDLSLSLTAYFENLRDFS